jgi:hypothetical protein
MWESGYRRFPSTLGLAVGAVINKFKVKKLKKHVDVDIKDRHFAFSRSAAKQR